jgi:hypothetical protein
MKLNTFPPEIWFRGHAAAWSAPFFFKTIKDNPIGAWTITRYPSNAYLSEGTWLPFHAVREVVQLNTADAEILECILHKHKEKVSKRWNGTDIVGISKFPLPYKKMSSVLKKGEILMVPTHESDWEGQEEE